MKQSDAALAFVRELCLEHCEEASHLWLLRRKAVQSPRYGLADLLELDNRLEAHVDALRMQARTCGDVCKESLERGHAGEFFSASVLVFESADEALIRTMIEKAAAAPGLSAGIVSALGWLPCEQAEPHIRQLLASGSTSHRFIGIAASALHRRDPGHHLDDALYSGDSRLKTRSLRAIGELGGRGDRMTLARLQEHLTAADEESRFWAAWSAALLGDAGAVHVLKPFVEPRSPFREKALNLAMRLMDGAAASAWQKELARMPCGQRLAVLAAGICGDPALVPWLLERMHDSALARIAGEAFTMITGVDLNREGLEGKRPKGFTAGPNDNPGDDNVAPDPDEDLPWPDAQLIAVWWEKNRGQFSAGKRRLAGRPITAENLLHVLETGRQPHRAAAAMELAILRPGRPLFDVCAPAFRQDHTGRKQ